VRAAGRGAVLVVFWLLAWGEASVANVVTGVVVAAALLTVFPSRRQATTHHRFSPVGGLRLAAYVLAQLVPSNLLVAREVMARRSRIRSGVLHHRLRRPSDEALNLMAHVIALSPGAMTVEVDRERGVLTVHFLLLDDVDRARASLQRIDDLVTGTVGGRRPSETSTDPAPPEAR
jgi:multicomponent Na+:H+ antiporter subunit E